MYNVTIFGIHLKLNPIAFTLPFGNGWNIYWYGIIIALGFTLAIIYGMKRASRFNIDTDRMLDIIIVTTPVSILCARAYYVIFDGEKLQSIGDFFGFGDSSGFSGLAIYGAVIGAFGCGAVMCKIRKVKILDIFDLAAIAFLIGQGVGRWGNFVNQEAFGAPTGSSWWGMTSENVVSDFITKGYDPNALAHPCFLYESIWCIIGFFVLDRLSKNRTFSGEITLMYCVWYGFGRAIIEFLRTDSLMIGKIKVSFLLSALVFLAATIAVLTIKNKLKIVKQDTEYVNIFDTEEENAYIKETDKDE